jgi:enoyl-CoA hydratase
MPRGRVPELKQDLAGLAWESGREAAQVEKLLGRFTGEAGPSPLAARQGMIDRCFRHDRVEAILDALQAETEDPDWAGETHAALLTKSPTSLRVTLRQLLLGRAMDLADALKLEYRLTQHFMAAHDFYEGIRAVLIDKDQKPLWRPATLAEVDEATTAAYFTSLGDRELTF